MELYAVDGERPVLHSHDLVFFRNGCDHKLLGKRLRSGNKGMIARHRRDGRAVSEEEAVRI